MEKIQKIKNLAIIPARMNSKRVTKKNARKLDGKPLFWHTVKAAMESSEVDSVLITTESATLIRLAKELLVKYYDAEVATGALSFQLIKMRTNKKPVYFVRRNNKLSMDHVQVSEVALDSLRSIEMAGFTVQNIVILQPTSPFRTRLIIDESIRTFNDVHLGKGTLFTGYIDNGFHWRVSTENAREEAIPLGHNPERRRGGQWEFNNYSIVRENGSLYVLRAETFSQETVMRVPPFHIYTVEDSIDIDTVEDFNKAKNIVEREK
jgi:CMP-N,N'-diacetyllegionaminic acid synthase